MAAAPPAGGDPSAAALARGSGLVFFAGMADKLLRWALKWALSGLLGPAGLGLLELANRIGATITAFSPLGADSAIVYFGARYRAAGEPARLAGALRVGLAFALLPGLAVGLGLFAVGVLAPAGLAADTARALCWVGPTVAVWSPLLVLSSALRSTGELRGSVFAVQVVAPALLLVLSVGAVAGLGAGVEGALAAWWASTAATLALVAWEFRRRFGAVLGDPALRPVDDWRGFAAFSLPQAMTAGAFRLNLVLDVLVLGALGSRADVGVYSVAASLAAFGLVPSGAVVAIFNPLISALVAQREIPRLAGLLRTVTRWLVLASAPAYLVLAVLPGELLSLYDSAYAAAAAPLIILIGGQAVQTVCAPAMRLIPMSGHAWLNLANGIGALVLNLGLLAWWVPGHGAVGAAWASSVTLAAWSLWRLAEIALLWRVNAFGLGALAPLLVAVGGGLGTVALSEGTTGRTLGLTLSLLALGAVAWLTRTPDDALVMGRVAARLRRR